MDKIVIKEDVIPGIGEIIHLYEDVEWSAYTNNPENLKLAIDKIITGSTEENIPVCQTAMGMTIIGIINKVDFRKV